MKKLLIAVFMIGILFMGAKEAVEQYAVPILGEIYPEPIIEG